MTAFEMESKPARLTGTPRRKGSRARPMALAFAGLLLSVVAASAQGYEAWVSDQANTQGISADFPSGTHNGKVRIYDGADLEQSPPVDSPLLLDISTDLFPMADITAGAYVTRIHGITPSPDHRYMALNFVVSGHLGIVDGETKLPVCLFRATESSTGRQNHMSFWIPDGPHVIVANQNGRLLERVDMVRDVNGAVIACTFNASASLDLVGGVGRVLTQPMAVDIDADDDISCTVSGMVSDGQLLTTPTGTAKQAPGLRPANTLICPIPTSTSQHVFATLGGGGLFVVDLRSTPMAIVAEYDLSIVRAAGCGGVEAAAFMHLNTGTPSPNVSEFTIYRFPLSYPSAPAFNPPNTPAPTAVWEDPDSGKVAGVDIPLGSNRDAHGMVLVHDVISGVPRYLHQMDRIRNNVEVFKIAPPWVVS